MRLSDHIRIIEKSKACEACDVSGPTTYDARFGGFVCLLCRYRLDDSQQALEQTSANAGAPIPCDNQVKVTRRGPSASSRSALEKQGRALATVMRKALAEFQRQPTDENRALVNRSMLAWQAYRAEAEQADA